MQALSKSRSKYHSTCNNFLINDVKLRECENAWKPARFVASAVMTEDEKKTEEIYKKVRGVLNKLAPANFERLLDQVRSLNIDTTERLQGVIDLVFEKAVDEPNFSVAYALLCRELALMQVPATDSKRKEGQEFVNFRKLLVRRCQLEFEKNSIDETERNRRIKEIDECTDPEKKKDMHLELEDYDRRLRMKSVGNIRFIGELFKQQMLTVNIMLRCVHNLLETKDDESLECLCTLLNTVGKELEAKKVNLSIIFDTIKDIADKKDGKISNTIRFMILDVIDLRASQWVSGRLILSRRTLDHIQKELRSELTDIRRKKWSTDKRCCRDTRKDDNWRSTAFSQNSPRQFQRKAPMMDEPLGSIQMFGNWGHGSSIKTQPPLNTNTASLYTALGRIASETVYKPTQGGLRMKSKDPCNSTTSSLGPNYRQSFEGQLSTGAAAVLAPAELTPDQLVERRIENIEDIVEEYVSDCCSVQECNRNIKTSISPSAMPQLVSYGYISVLERSRTARLRTGYLFAQLIKLGTLSLQDYCVGLETVLEVADELIIDIPKVWDYVAELISSVVCVDSETLENFQNVFELLKNKEYSLLLLFSLLKLIMEEKGNDLCCSDYLIIEARNQTMVVFEDSESLSRNVLEEYLNGNWNLQQCKQYVTDCMSSSSFSQLVSDGYMNVLEKSKKERLQTGFFFAELIKLGTLPLKSYCVGLSSVLEEANQLIFDVPIPVLCKTKKTAVDWHQLFDLLTKNHSIKLLSCLCKMFIQTKT